MKRWLIAGLILLTLVIASIYIFIPGRVSIQQNLSVAATREGVYRVLWNEKTWNKWWPADSTNSNSDSGSFRYDESLYTINAKTISSLVIDIVRNKVQARSLLILLSTRVDSVTFNWEATIPTSSN